MKAQQLQQFVNTLNLGWQWEGSDGYPYLAARIGNRQELAISQPSAVTYLVTLGTYDVDMIGYEQDSEVLVNAPVQVEAAVKRLLKVAGWTQD